MTAHVGCISTIPALGISLGDELVQPFGGLCDPGNGVRKLFPAGKPQERPPSRPPRPCEGETQYGLRARDAELENVRAAVEGQRRTILNKAAVKLGGLIAGGHLDESTTASGLTEAGLSVGLSAREVDTTVRNGLRDGKQRPRGPEPKPASPPRLSVVGGSKKVVGDRRSRSRPPAPGLQATGPALNGPRRRRLSWRPLRDPDTTSMLRIRATPSPSP